MQDAFATRGFLPLADPLRHFPLDSPYAVLDEIGESLPERLTDPGFRTWAESLALPMFEQALTPSTLPALRLYYVRLGFLASGYVNQTCAPPTHRLPASIAVPLAHACGLLDRPPMLSYDGYALYNWYRMDPAGPIALGNIDTTQNFVGIYDEHWFILVHVEIEALAAKSLRAMLALDEARAWHKAECLNDAIRVITHNVVEQTAVLRRIPERMSPDLYFAVFRPYIRFFENVVYEGVDVPPANHRGETGAQSSVVPALVSFFKIRHEPSALTRHVADMRSYMPSSHRQLLARLDASPDVRAVADPALFNAAMEAIAEFRSVHYGFAQEYIDKRVRDPRGTGGTPFMHWLKQLIDETLAHRIAARPRGQRAGGSSGAG
jgi:indoleamine 2,3-dioxygenase